MNDLQQIWNNSMNLMKSELTSVSFETWIGSIEPLSMNNDTIILSTINTFTRQILEDRYLILIKNAIKEVTSKEYNIKMVSPEINSENKEKFENTEIQIKEMENEKKFNSSLLNPKYIFSEFIIGNSNRFAHAGSLAVAESPANAYNPLFIYGGVGLGKTHLMHAIGHYVKNQNKNANIIYVTSEKFTNDLINSIKDDKNVEFRNKYRKADILLVDDIQFIAGKERTQEEFFHTFNALHEANKQIVLSSDRPPKEIQTLEARLRSRFEWGLITDIQAPDYETRVAILQKKAEHDNVYIPNDVFTFIASKIKSNIRELEGALIRVVAYSSLTNKEISVELSNEALKDIISDNKPRKITVDLIIDVICKNYNITPKELISKRRSRNISFPRQIAMYICRDLTDLSLPKIGEEFGGRDHTTVIHAKDKINTQMKEDFDFNNTVKNLIKEIVGD
ncbi:MAG: chromosomal replication initiator protein DnaA [Bacillota bacterium]|nr:chromosomal replication initiator protein DnaA [Bacillota bacterium]